jgi:hypothetical protein
MYERQLGAYSIIAAYSFNIRHKAQQNLSRESISGQFGASRSTVEQKRGAKWIRPSEEESAGRSRA